MKTKKFRLKRIEDAAGEVTAVIATLNVKDHDGDVTLPGAFGEQEAPIVPTHDWGSVPLGKAMIREDGDDVVARMQFNLDIGDAQKWYSALKFDFENGRPLQEYSYGYEILEADRGERDGERVQFLKKLKTVEVSPVLLGAGINTRTLEVKADRKAQAEIGGSWESIQRMIRNAARAEIVGDDEAGYVYPEATFDGRAIVEAYREWEPGEWTEKYFEFDWTLQDDGGVRLSNQREVELDLLVRAKNATLADQFELAVGELKRLHRRSKALAALREKEGRTLSRATRVRLSRLPGLAGDLHADLDALLAEAGPGGHEGKELAAFLEAQSRIAALREVRR